MNDLLALRAIDKRLGYKWVKFGGATRIEDVALLRVQNGSFELTGKLHPIPLALTDGEALATVQRWAATPESEVVIMACCCVKCHTAEAKAFQSTVGRISHGVWAECVAEEMDRISRELQIFMREQAAQKAA
jgi:hypothetical protein